MPPPDFTKKLQAIRKPLDYFSGTRTSPLLWPQKILCFTRKNIAESKAEVLGKHHHHRYVLVIPCRGIGNVYVDDQRFKLEHPHALLIFPFQFHHGFVLNQNNSLWLIITFETDQAANLESLRIAPHRTMEAGDIELLEHLAGIWNDSKRNEELAYWLGLFLARMQTSESVSVPHKLPSAKSTPLIMRINKLCMPNLHLPLGVKEIADKLSISESHLRARFRQETGMSLGHHLRRLRLQKSIGLLLQSELSISQIAERCGFDSVFTFSRSFRNFTGITAKNYRARFSQA